MCKLFKFSQILFVSEVFNVLSVCVCVCVCVEIKPVTKLNIVSPNNMNIICYLNYIITESD